MAITAQQIQAARKAGYSDDEIVSHLSATDQQMKTAVKAGYSATEIMAHFDQYTGGGKTPSYDNRVTDKAEIERRRKEFVLQEDDSVAGKLRRGAKAVAPYVRPVLEGGGAALGSLVGAGGGSLAGLAASVPTGGVAAPGTVPYGAIAGGVAGGSLGYAGGKYLADALEGAPQSAGQTLKDLQTGAKYEMGGAAIGPAVGMAAKSLNRLPKPGMTPPVNPRTVPLGMDDLSQVQKPPVKPEKIDNIIDTGISKGVRPSVVGNKTYKQAEQYRAKAHQAVRQIVENKDALNLTDEYGEAAKGLPQNLRQFSQAIDQTKGNIFKQYDGMAKQAGDAGAAVDLSPIPAELFKVANNKSLKLAAPDAANYAAKRAEAFKGGIATFDGVSTKRNNLMAAEQVQETIAMFNQSLDAFYKSPSYDTASKAYIDSLIVNHLRKGLDDVIDKAVGPGYQELKRAYGALKAIEKDVAHRSVIDARKNVKGLLDFSDVFSGSQVVGGLMSMNPATVGAGVTSKIIANLYKIKNDPNRIVANMFKQVDKYHKPPNRIAPDVPQGPKPTVGENPMAGKVNTLNVYPPAPAPNPMAGKVNTLADLKPHNSTQYRDPFIGASRDAKNEASSIVRKLKDERGLVGKDINKPEPVKWHQLSTVERKKYYDPQKIAEAGSFDVWDRYEMKPMRFNSIEEFKAFQEANPFYPVDDIMGAERVWYRKGDIPKNGHSTNYAEGRNEKGVSVYGHPDEANVFFSDRETYSGPGRQIGWGSDGEPLIVPTGKWTKMPTTRQRK